MILKDQSLLQTQAYINGAFVDAKDRQTFPVFNPFNKERIADVSRCGVQDAESAVLAAQEVFELFSQSPSQERAALLMRWHDLIASNADDLAMILSLEQGKTLPDALGEINYGNSFIAWFAGEATRIHGDVVLSDDPTMKRLVIKQGIGVTAAITPWNFPIAMITRKCAPALAAGCSVVIKPSEETPLSALALAVLAERAGFPPGVINVLAGEYQAIGEVLTTHPLVKKFSFTGSTPVGRQLMRQCASTVKQVTLELGGNAPVIVFEDADIAQALDGVMALKLRASGQVCIAANRIFVHDAVYDEFIEGLVSRFQSLTIGSGQSDGTDITALINQSGFDKVSGLVDNAVASGAGVLCGGSGSKQVPLAYIPTVLRDVTPSMQIYQTEIFGPVASIVRFHDEADVVRLANDTPYGLASYFFTQDTARIFRVSEALQYGMVGVNTGSISDARSPFGGVKQSGVGREGSHYGMDAFLNIKYVCLNVA